jgi:uncharacterized membrane protein (UPF0127 family)
VRVPIRKVLLAALLAALSVGVAAPFGQASSAQAHERQGHAATQGLDIVTTAGKVAHFKVEFVDTEPTRERGLMYRKSLAPDAGMLFDFKTPQQVSFWMKNTLIPLDMLFIDQSGRISNIYREATPLSLAPIPSDGPIRGVLEIPGGRAQELGIMAGDKVRHPIFTTH